MPILGLLGMYFDAAVVFVTKSSLLFRLAVVRDVFQNPAPLIGRRLSAYSLPSVVQCPGYISKCHIIFFVHFFMFCKAIIDFGEV